MADTFPSFGIQEIQGGNSTLEGHEEVFIQEEQVPTFEIEGSAAVDPICSDYRYGILQENMSEETIRLFENQEDAISEASQPIQFKPYSLSTAPFELLSNYIKANKMPTYGDLNNLSSKVPVEGQKISAQTIMRVAGERYIHFSNQHIDGITTFIHPYGTALSNLSTEETSGADLAHLLLAAAEKVGYKQFDSASKLLTHCETMASESGSPVEKIVFYFVAALRERINRETGSITIKTTDEQERRPNGLPLGADFTMLAVHQGVPFSKVMHFASMQTIIDNFAVATKVHIIDLQIRSGIQWTPLIQALSERKTCPAKLLKITALATTDKQKVEETGNRLQSYAKSMNVPFSFKIVFLSNMKDLREELFDIKPGEAVAVYSSFVLRTMISTPDSLETLMRVIQRLRPSIMVVSEVEASHNSPSFVSRFIEALFFYSAWFDCLDDCMDRDDQYRMNLEKNYFGKGIQNIVATEGEARHARSVKMIVWRAFFARFKMVELELSRASLDQAKLVLEKQFSCGSSCTITKNGKCLIVGWKGTPFHSLSTWKFK